MVITFLTVDFLTQLSLWSRQEKAEEDITRRRELGDGNERREQFKKKDRKRSRHNGNFTQFNLYHSKGASAILKRDWAPNNAIKN